MITLNVELQEIIDRIRIKQNTDKRKNKLEKEKPIFMENACNKREEIKSLLNLIAEKSLCETCMETDSLFEIYSGYMNFETADEILEDFNSLHYFLDSSLDYVLSDYSPENIRIADLIENYKIFPVPAVSPLSFWKFPEYFSLFSAKNNYPLLTMDELETQSDLYMLGWYGVELSNLQHITSLISILMKSFLYFIHEFSILSTLNLERFVNTQFEGQKVLVLLATYLKYGKEEYKKEYLKALKKDKYSMLDNFIDDFIDNIYEYGFIDPGISECIFRHKARKILTLLIDNNHWDENKSKNKKLEKKIIFEIINKNFEKFLSKEDFKKFQTLTYYLIYKEQDFISMLYQIYLLEIPFSNPLIAIDNKNNRRKIKKLYEIFLEHSKIVNEIAFLLEETFEKIDIDDIENQCIKTIKEFFNKTRGLKNG